MPPSLSDATFKIARDWISSSWKEHVYGRGTLYNAGQRTPIRHFIDSLDRKKYFNK